MVAGDVPGALDLPTGLGKTSVMAVWLLASAVNLALPRRLVYVVDRRAVVEQASAEAERLREALAGMAALSARLGAPAVSTLRGQLLDNGAWTERPDATAIIVGTVDMIGSRLLFSGYGMAPRMRPGRLGRWAMMPWR